MLSLLKVQNFRNLSHLEWGLAEGSHLLLGGNGAGKTSVLEAIHVLATTRSFRTSQIQDCVQHETSGFNLRGEVNGERRAQLEVAFQSGERSRFLNGKSSSLAEHLGVLPVVAWTATSEAEILVGAPVARRRFLDRGVVGLRPGSLETLSRYREALFQKRRLLLEGGGGIEAWNDLLAGEAAAVIEQRSRYVELVRGHLQEVVVQAGLPFPSIDLRYRPSPSVGLEGKESILRALERMADSERRRRIPLVGPHRDELEILWDGHEIRRVASAGERKALSLLLLATHAAVLASGGRAPLILLDDADAELSPQTTASVWQVFVRARQVLVTSNRPQVWLTQEIGALWEMEKGVLRSLA